MTDTEPRRLIVMRHAKAGSSGSSDHDRDLTERGRLQSRAVGVWLAGEGLVPEIVLVSSATRALSTWREVWAGMTTDTEPDVRLLESLYGADEYDVIAACVAEIPAETASAIVVGHNPTIEATADLLQRESDRGDVSFPTAALAVFEIESGWADLQPGGGTLAGLYTPPG